MAPIDNHVGRARPNHYTSAAAVTPSDTVDLTNVTLALMNVGTAGAASVIMQDGQTVSVNFPVGVMIPIRVTRVRATGLGASVSLVAFW